MDKKSEKIHAIDLEKSSAAEKLISKGQYDEARNIYKYLINKYPQVSAIWFNSSRLEARLGKRKEERAMLEQALLLQPTLTVALSAKGLSHYADGEYKDAIKFLKKAYDVENDVSTKSKIANDLGAALKHAGNMDGARKAFQASIKLNPTDHKAWNNLGNSFKDLCLFDNAEKAYRKSIELSSDKFYSAYSNYLFSLHYDSEKTLEEIRNEIEKWYLKYGNSKSQKNKLNLLPEHSKRIGIVSGSLRKHPVGYMTTAVWEHLAKNGWQIFVFSDTVSEDEVTNRFKAIANEWINISFKNDSYVANQIKSRNISVLFDLSGHSSGCRLQMFAQRVAPIQVKWVGGLFNTTGLPEMDYLISDSMETPDGIDPWYSENLIRMPDGYVTYEPPEYLPEVTELPCKSNGYITFGCFNNATKLSDALIKIWAEIFKKLPTAKLILKYRHFSNSETAKYFEQRLIKLGIPKNCLILDGHSPHKELLKRYNDVDIALDTWPYSGGLTTVEALVMGVPVVSLPGPTFAGRHSCSHLSNIGLDDWVVDSSDAYVKKVLEASNNISYLNELRKDLRHKVVSSALCDHKKFASHLSNVLTNLVARELAGEIKSPCTVSSDGQFINNKVVDRVDLSELKDVHSKQLVINEDIQIKIPTEPHFCADGFDQFKKEINLAKTYLEYGMGGSTSLMSMEKDVKIISVDSDLSWVNAMKNQESIKNRTNISLLHANIGKTRKWGFPIDVNSHSNWSSYVAAPWEEVKQKKWYPDLILIDGRFRLASFIYSLIQSKVGAVILFDDYFDRPHYFDAEIFCKVSSVHGRMAKFIVNDSLDVKLAISRLLKAISDPR